MTATPTAYRRHRRNPRATASLALALARMETATPAGWGPGDTHEWTGPGGWTYTAELRWDDDVDRSWLGEFTDDDGYGTIPNPGNPRERDASRYARFRPANPGAAEIPYYWAAGMGRHDAWLAAMALDRGAAERAASDDGCYVAEVTAAHPYYGTGSAALHGIEDDHPYACCWQMAADELAPEARGNAIDATARRLARLAHTAPAMIEGVPA